MMAKENLAEMPENYDMMDEVISFYKIKIS